MCLLDVSDRVVTYLEESKEGSVPGCEENFLYQVLVEGDREGSDDGLHCAGSSRRLLLH